MNDDDNSWPQKLLYRQLFGGRLVLYACLLTNVLNEIAQRVDYRRLSAVIANDIVDPFGETDLLSSLKDLGFGDR